MILTIHNIYGVITVATLFAIPSVTSSWADEPTTLADMERSLTKEILIVEREYQDQMNTIRQKRLDGLKRLLDHALESKDLDNAIELQEKIEASERELKAQGPIILDDRVHKSDVTSLENFLKGTSWKWGTKGSIRFDPDGTIDNKGWTGRRLITTWTAIDRRTVLFFIQRGRLNDRYAILTFSPDLTSYSGYSFDGSVLRDSERQ